MTLFPNGRLGLYICLGISNEDTRIGAVGGAISPPKNLEIEKILKLNQVTEIGVLW